MMDKIKKSYQSPVLELLSSKIDVLLSSLQEGKTVTDTNWDD